MVLRNVQDDGCMTFEKISQRDILEAIEARPIK